MSEIKSKADTQIVQSTEDVIELHKGTLTNPNMQDGQSRMGVELEFNLYDIKTLSPLNETTNADIIKAGAEANIPIHQEPSLTTLEIISEPFKSCNITKLITQVERRFSSFIEAAQNHNSFTSPFAHLPHIKPEEHHLTRNERYNAFWVPARDDMQGIFQSFLEPSIQVSVSYKDWDHLLRIIRLSVALESFLLLSTEASSKFFYDEPIGFCPRFRMFSTRRRNGGVPDFYYTSRSGEELINSHIDHTLNNPHMFAAFDFDNNLKQLPSGEWPSFMELEEKGYGPQNFLNYRQSQSESWRRTTNIAEIRNIEGDVYGYRAEISSLFATGLQHQRISAVLLTYLMAYDDSFYNKINDLMAGFGINLNALDSSKTLLEQNYEQATNHKGHYHGLPFGTKTIKDFALPFADIVEENLRDTVLAEYAPPLLHILREGRPDWLVYREAFQTIEEVKSYMQKLPELIKEEPELISSTSCADWTLPEILKKAF